MCAISLILYKQNNYGIHKCLFTYTFEGKTFVGCELATI